MLINKQLEIYDRGNMILFLDPTLGLMETVPKGSVRIEPFQAPNVGFKFIDLRTYKLVGQIRNFNDALDVNGNPWGLTYKAALENLCFFFAEINPVEILNRSVFGDLVTTNNKAIIQASGVYDFIPANFRTSVSLSGTVGVEMKHFTANTGTTAGATAVIQSLRALKQAPGLGAVERFSCIFDAGVVDSQQGIGLMSATDELSFGKNGTEFGIWHRYWGVLECRTITVTAPAGGATDLTLTLDSIAYVIPLTAGTAAFNAYQIADWLKNNQSVWTAEQIDDTVIILAVSDGARAGTYSYSHATSTGTIVQNKAGATKTSDFIPQTSWNRNTVSWLDPTMGNAYKINYQQGYGDIKFYVENVFTGNYILVHTIQWTNMFTQTSLSNPSLRFGMYAYSVGSTTNVKVRCSTVGAFIQGEEPKIRNPRGVQHTQNLDSASFKNILTIRNRRSYKFNNNLIEVEPELLIISSESNKIVNIELRTNGIFSGPTNYTQAGADLVTDVETTANTVTNGTLLASLSVPANGTAIIDLKELEIIIPPSVQFSISGKINSGGTTADVSASFTYYEDL